MRNSVAAIWVFVASLVLVNSLLMTAEANAQTLDRGLTLRDLSFELTTPQDIARYIWKNFLYEDDQRLFGVRDRWQSPEELLKNKRGDCEDFALFAREVLRLQGYHTFLLNLYGDRYAHTLCIYKENGKYRALDGTEVLPYAEVHLNDLIQKIHSPWKSGAIVTPSHENTRSKILKEFDRRLKAREHILTAA
ncbi:MAG: transglutaminase-like cysteine peptidase [Candidatus Omnitrophica bacterium]|nr:transglutaminase-like cysteine peptidase [Candidatus Omnitrophota bacterium]